MSTTPRIARVYFSLRTAHLKRFRLLDPSTVIYCRTRYDFDPEAGDLEPRLLHLGRIARIWHLLTNTYDVVEVNEPAIAWLWGDLLLQVAAIRVRSRITRTNTSIVTYCIGLVDPADDLAGHRLWPPWVVKPLTKPVLRVLARSMKRVAFGTTASHDMYARYVGSQVLSQRSAMFEAVPSCCSCVVDNADLVRYDNSVVFVGAFIERKGIDQLMRAWEVVHRLDPNLVLTLIGKGRRESDVRDWASRRPEVSVIIDPPRAMIHEALGEAVCSVLLSQRVGHWREQVGLPIVEALAHGCEVVATEETGLASWLRAHGHAVLPTTSTAEAVADAVLATVAGARSREAVLSDLPTEDRRLGADQWMVWGEPIDNRVFPESG